MRNLYNYKKYCDILIHFPTFFCPLVCGTDVIPNPTFLGKNIFLYFSVKIISFIGLYLVRLVFSDPSISWTVTDLKYPTNSNVQNINNIKISMAECTSTYKKFSINVRAYLSHL